MFWAVVEGLSQVQIYLQNYSGPYYNSRFGTGKVRSITTKEGEERLACTLTRCPGKLAFLVTVTNMALLIAPMPREPSHCISTAIDGGDNSRTCPAGRERKRLVDFCRFIDEFGRTFVLHEFQYNWRVLPLSTTIVSSIWYCNGGISSCTSCKQTMNRCLLFISVIQDLHACRPRVDQRVCIGLKISLFFFGCASLQAMGSFVQQVFYFFYFF